MPPSSNSARLLSRIAEALGTDVEAFHVAARAASVGGARADHRLALWRRLAVSFDDLPSDAERLRAVQLLEAFAAPGGGAQPPSARVALPEKDA